MQTVTVGYATAAGTVKAGQDYTAASGTLTFDPGQTSRTIPVSVPGDNPPLADAATESSETFAVTLSSPVAATIADGSATGTILKDDRPVPHTGQYGGTTTQGLDLTFQVSNDLTGITNLHFDFDVFCGNLGGGTITVDWNQPIKVNQADWSFSDAVRRGLS